jgi:hypothetical protein
VPGGARQLPDAAADTQNRPGPRKNFNQKKAPIWTKADEQREVKKRLKRDKEEAKHRPVPGAPDIAHPGEKEKWERQTAFVTAWFLEMLERVESDDEKAGHAARCELQELLLNTIGQVLRVAQKSKAGVAKEWAGELLAIIGVSIGRQDRYNKKLKANTAYAEMKKKLSGKGLTSALFPKGKVCAIVQRELKKAERYRERLRRLSAIRNRKITEGERRQLGLLKDRREAARQEKIPEAYWPLRNFPEFSVKSEPKWWEFLSPLIRKKIDLLKLKPLKRRAYDELRVFLRNGKPQVRERDRKNRKRYPSDTAAREHLILLARLRDAGIFY